MTQLRLKAYAPNGAALGPLPTPLGIETSWVLSDLSALTLSYPAHGPRSDLLGQPLEVAAEVSADRGATWAEPQGARFMLLRDDRDPVQDSAWSATGLAYVTRLKKAVVGFTGLDDEGRRTFTAKTVGFILQTLMTEAQARGALVGFAWDFGNTTDSLGSAWAGPAASVTMSYDTGRDLLSILQEFATLGWVDFTTQGRTLKMFNPGNGNVDRTTVAPLVTLRRGQDLTEGPTRRTWENLADRALVRGDSGKTTTRTAVGATAPWGPQETYVAAGGVEDAGTLAAIGDAALALTKEVRAEYTLGLDFGDPDSPYRPFRHYFLGDWVGVVVTPGTAPAKRRVRQITLTRGARGEAGGNVVLNDRFTEADVANQRRLDALTNGAGLAGTGGNPTGVGPDILAPAQVVGAVATSIAYTSAAGLSQAQITVDWSDVTTNADGTAITDLKGYQVRRRKTGEAWATVAGDVAASVWSSSPYEPGSMWEFAARAVDTAGNEGAWSATASVTATYDTTGPIAPKAPSLVSRLGGIQVLWDGVNGVNGGAMDPDMWLTQVHVSTVSGFAPVKNDPATYRGTIEAGGGGLYVGNLTYDTTQYVRLLPIDTTGNAGTPSAQTSVVVKPLVDVSNFPDAAMETLYARTAKFIDLTADNFQANLIEGAWIKGGTITGALLSGDAIDGKTITGALFQTSALTSVDRMMIDAYGLRFYKANASGYSLQITPAGDLYAFGDDSGGGIITSQGSTRAARLQGGQVVVQTIDGTGNLSYPILSHQPNMIRWTGGTGPNQWQAILRNPANEGLYLQTGDGPMVLTPNGTLYLTPAVNDDVLMQATGTGALTLDNSGSGDLVLGRLNSVGYVVSPGIYDKTASSSANVYIAPSGRLYRSTSSRRYKTGVRAWDVDDLAVWGDRTRQHPGLRPKTFLDKRAVREHRKDPTQPKPERIAGWTAEDVNALGLTVLVDYDPTTGAPDSIPYDRALPVVWPALRRDHFDLVDLKATVATILERLG